MVAKVDREAIVPVFRRHAFEYVPVVARRIVDEHRDRSPFGFDVRQDCAQRVDIADVAAVVAHRRRREPRHEHLRKLVRDVAKRNARALSREALDDEGANPRAAARNKDGAAGETRIAGNRAADCGGN